MCVLRYSAEEYFILIMDSQTYGSKMDAAEKKQKGKFLEFSLFGTQINK